MPYYHCAVEVDRHCYSFAVKLVPFQQSVDFNKKLVAAGVSSHLITINGGGHGNFGKANDEVNKIVAQFFAKHLRDQGEGAAKDRTLEAK